MILADTDVLIDSLRGKEPSRSRVAGELEQDTLATSSITVFELTSGARSDKQADSIADLLAVLRVLPFDTRAAQAAADVRRHLEGSGQPIGMADYLIAGIAVSRSIPLMTRNRRHFERVPGILLTSP